MTKDSGLNIDEVKRYAREKFGNNFELDNDNVKELYFAENCQPLFYYVDNYFQQFSRETLISWNEEYLNNIEKIAQNYYEESLSLENMDNYALYLKKLVDIFTTKKDFGYRIMSLIKQFIKKYGYILFYGIENKETQFSKQYPYVNLFNCIFYKISIDTRPHSIKHVSVQNMLFDSNYRGLIPFAIENGLEDLYKECIELFYEIHNSKNLVSSLNLLKKFDSRFCRADLSIIEMTELFKNSRKQQINDYLRQFGREIK